MIRMHIAPQLIPQVAYPLIEKGFDIHKNLMPKKGLRRLDRVQVRLGPDRFAIMIRHTELGHWCGYVMIPENTWDSIPPQVMRQIRRACPEKITYVGPANAYVTWCGWTKKSHKLSIPVSIQANEVDHWVGFTTHSEPPIADTDDMYSRLLQFEDFLRGQIG